MLTQMYSNFKNSGSKKQNINTKHALTEARRRMMPLCIDNPENIDIFTKTTAIPWRGMNNCPASQRFTCPLYRSEDKDTGKMSR
jgi:hypothetical protein